MSAVRTRLHPPHRTAASRQKPQARNVFRVPGALGRRPMTHLRGTAAIPAPHPPRLPNLSRTITAFTGQDPPSNSTAPPRGRSVPGPDGGAALSVTRHDWGTLRGVHRFTAQGIYEAGSRDQPPRMTTRPDAAAEPPGNVRPYGTVTRPGKEFPSSGCTSAPVIASPARLAAGTRHLRPADAPPRGLSATPSGKREQTRPSRNGGSGTRSGTESRGAISQAVRALGLRRSCRRGLQDPVTTYAHGHGHQSHAPRRAVLRAPDCPHPPPLTRGRPPPRRLTGRFVNGVGLRAAPPIRICASGRKWGRISGSA